MSPPPPVRTPLITIDDYLDGELQTEVKHEYLAGEVVAMGVRAPGTA